MDFQLDYDLPYLDDIYNDVIFNSMYKCVDWKYGINDRMFYNKLDVIDAYYKFLIFVQSVVSNDVNIKNYIFPRFYTKYYELNAKFRLEPHLPFEQLNSVKKWMRKFSNKEYSIPAMKLMLIMRYFDEYKLPQKISDYCNKHGIEAFSNNKLVYDVTYKQLYSMYGLYRNDYQCPILLYDTYSALPNLRFELLSGYYLYYNNKINPFELSNTNVLTTTFKSKQTQFDKLISALKHKCRSLFNLNTANFDVNIPIILYRNICNNLFCDINTYYIGYDIMVNFSEYLHKLYYYDDSSEFKINPVTIDTVDKFYYTPMKYLYSSVNFCHMYAKSEHDTSLYNPYHDFVNRTLFKPFKEHYGYPFNKTDMINAVNDCNNRTNFDDFIYTKTNV